MEQFRASSSLSFARSLFQAAEGKELFNQEFVFASAVSTYYCLFHVGGALILAYCSCPESTDDPNASIRNRLEREWKSKQQGRPANNSPYTFPDPAEGIRHDDVPQFLKRELPQIAESLGSRGQRGALRDMREFVSYAPRLLSNGLTSVLYSGCQYEPQDFRRYLEQHLGRIDEFFRNSIQWLRQKRYDEVHMRILSGDFILFEFAELRSYHSVPVGKQAWAIYRSICEHEGMDCRAYRPDPRTWHTDESDRREGYQGIIQSLGCS